MASFPVRLHSALPPLVRAVCVRAIVIWKKSWLSEDFLPIIPRSFALVQHSAPELDQRCRVHLKACNDSWKVDETDIKVENVWLYLYRAVDCEGNTIEFFLSPTRDAEAAKHFFCKALHVPASSTPQECSVQKQVAQPTALTDLNIITSAPRVINVEKNAAYPKAIAPLQAAGMLPEAVELRQVKYLNNLVEQDHRFIKRLRHP